MSNYDKVLELETPHGFLIAQEKQTAIARVEPLDTKQSYLIVSNGEAFGVVEFGQPAQVKTKEFDTEEWQAQHRITQRERRQWWPDSEVFYVYQIKNWRPFEGIKLYEDGQVIDEPRLTADQWKIVSAAKELPKQITLIDEAISISTDYKFSIKGSFPIPTDILQATYQIEPEFVSASSEYIPLYSLALVRNPRMRVSKKSLEMAKKEEIKQKDEPMPYRIRQRDNEYCVVKINADDSDGESQGCHETREEAEAQLTALNINVVAEEKEIFDDEESIEQQLTFIRRQFEDQFNPNNGMEKVSSSYAWVNDIFDGFVIVDEEGLLYRVDYIMVENSIVFSPRERWVEVKRGYIPKGVKHLGHFNDNGMLARKTRPKAKKDTFTQRLKRAAKNILDIITLAETEENEVRTDILTSNYGVAQKKVNGELWHFTWSTNAFEDREGEIFSTKSLEKYVLEAEKKTDRGYFNLWHINAEDGNFNTDFARKEWQGVMGRFLVEAGPYLENSKGQAAKEFFSKYPDGHPDIAPEGWGCSPEFRYLPEERETGVYENIWITRTSTLPKFAAANVWTDTRQLARSKNMALSEDQMKAAIAAFGKDEIDNLIAEAEKRTAELEAANVAHKEKKEEEPQQLNMEDLAAEVGKQFTANLTPIAEAMEAMASELKALKEWKEAQDKAAAVKDKTESPRFIFEMKRASEDDGTIVTEDDSLKGKKPVETQAAQGDPWAQVFNK